MKSATLEILCMLGTYLMIAAISCYSVILFAHFLQTFFSAMRIWLLSEIGY
ncbi:hypothetical protein [Haliscomenobacter hydrossis]|uniref:Uncharacterized protein n=1 Tax=Haliscomenobacter hydrossis (strain ATCC 27775 / DSM 1100 / LMG 10767 / O) TaxID=760192 RepID=F4KQE0_HALH1|nr:hypothetical protein [Haliscomenobacter hydrossis]AEE48966.1 hypothetical protein Halhy_1067 [Haliscomenobacter hydrossis DSM 1100]